MPTSSRDRVPYGTSAFTSRWVLGRDPLASLPSARRRAASVGYGRALAEGHAANDVYRLDRALDNGVDENSRRRSAKLGEAGRRRRLSSGDATLVYLDEPRSPPHRDATNYALEVAGRSRVVAVQDRPHAKAPTSRRRSRSGSTPAGRLATPRPDARLTCPRRPPRVARAPPPRARPPASQQEALHACATAAAEGRSDPRGATTRRYSTAAIFGCVHHGRTPRSRQPTIAPGARRDSPCRGGDSTRARRTRCVGRATNRLGLGRDAHRRRGRYARCPGGAADRAEEPDGGTRGVGCRWTCVERA